MKKSIVVIDEVSYSIESISIKLSTVEGVKSFSILELDEKTIEALKKTWQNMLNLQSTTPNKEQNND